MEYVSLIYLPTSPQRNSTYLHSSTSLPITTRPGAPAPRQWRCFQRCDLFTPLLGSSSAKDTRADNGRARGECVGSGARRKSARKFITRNVAVTHDDTKGFTPWLPIRAAVEWAAARRVRCGR